MRAEPEHGDESDGRLSDRTNMFIAASLLVDGAACPARVRNMSPKGALVETAVLPQRGRAIELIRGPLRVTGEVMWRDAQRCGVRFRSNIVVADWLASCAPSRNALGAAAAVAADAAAAELGTDVARMRELLDRLGDDLAGDADVLTRHARSLQTLDIVDQMLVALGDAVAADAEIRAVGFGRLTALRFTALETLRG